VVTNEFKSVPEPGDFLIRNIIGVDPRTGVIAVGDRLRSGQRVQLHLRDAQASAQDLRDALERYTHYVAPDAPGVAALMFSCVGRGERLYGKSNFDSQLLREYLGTIPLDGFFCSGEIGPVADVTYLHGYTTVLGILRPRA
jgi:small ligand-binding sensory domain FIST